MVRPGARRAHPLGELSCWPRDHVYSLALQLAVYSRQRPAHARPGGADERIARRAVAAVKRRVTLLAATQRDGVLVECLGDVRLHAAPFRPWRRAAGLAAAAYGTGKRRTLLLTEPLRPKRCRPAGHGPACGGFRGRVAGGGSLAVDGAADRARRRPGAEAGGVEFPRAARLGPVGHGPADGQGLVVRGQDGRFSRHFKLSHRGTCSFRLWYVARQLVSLRVRGGRVGTG